jgi:hypothetical protein
MVGDPEVIQVGTERISTGKHGSDKHSMIAGHSLRCGLNTPPTASQASAWGVARETQSVL